MLKIAKDLFDLLYPVGTYYETSNASWTPSSASGTHYGYGWESDTGMMYNNMPSSLGSIGNTGGGQGHSHNIATKGIYVWQRTA